MALATSRDFETSIPTILAPAEGVTLQGINGTAVAAWLAASVCAICVSLFPTLVRSEPTASPGKLQIYVMPDTQSWAWNQGGTSLATWRAVAQALCRQRDRFAMVLHTGDLVDNPRLHPFEWDNAQSVMQQLDACRMPYAIAFGNHDFDNYPPPEGEGAVRGDKHWKALVAQLAHRPLETAPSGKTALHSLAPGWFVIAADFMASEADLTWIGAQIGKHHGSRFVLLNHWCVNAQGIGVEWCRQLFEQHAEIRIAVSGHWLGAIRDGWNEVPRANGRRLISLYQDYQHVPDLAAWGVVIELDPASGDVCVWSESLLDGAVGHPAAASREVGEVAAGSARRCFEGSTRQSARESLAPALSAAR